MKKHVVFFGDSLTAGECNNNISFANYFAQFEEYSCTICGVSGSCFGNYSIYPVEDNLLKMISLHELEIKNADIIVIEFALNDTAAITTGYVDNKKVYISIVKSVDYIMQLNPAVKIFFVLPVESRSTIYYRYLQNYIDYLNNDYFKNYSFPYIKYNDFSTNYLKLVDFIQSIQYTNTNVIFINNSNIAEDGIHLNDAGHHEFANILKQVFYEHSFIS